MTQKSVILRLLGRTQGDGLRAQLLRGGAGVGALRLVSLPLTLLTTVLLARLLGPQGFGQYSFVVAVITTLTIPLAPALLQLITRETAALYYAGEYGQIRQLSRWANRRVIIGSLIIIVVVTIGVVNTSDWSAGGRWILLLMILPAVPLLGLNAVRLGILTGLRKVISGQIPDLFVKPVALLVVVGAFATGGVLTPSTGVLSYVLSAAIAYIVGFVLLNRAVSAHWYEKKQLAQSQSRSLTKAWVPFTLLVAANTLNTQIGILVLGWLSTDKQVAAMQIAAQGGMVVALSLTIVNQVIGPYVTQIYHAGDKDRLLAISRSSVRFALLLATPLALLLITCGEFIIEIVFGIQYVSIGVLPLAILAIAQFVNVAFGSVGTFLTMSGYERDTLLGQVSGLVSSSVASLILVPMYGATGAAIAVALGTIVWNGVLAIQVSRRIGIRPGPI
ncbi:oligosaccharide flippase family protein [Marinobacter alexandrii]|uniref:oligosaccharide flippase family protein n=1 Tax=Marinobacter alexandrii TaxID=2570351 RepID=UPI001FFFA08F|nr:oligosaccharide flippase family protein [Marinobacter alexandrii]MCK2150076.1 oligosaccharide flippase family protein [Marinobacter alexandrii]